MTENYDYAEMIAARDSFRDVFAKMQTILDTFDSSTSAFASSIKAKISDAALALVTEVGDIIADAKEHVETMNEYMGKGAEGIMETNEEGAEEIDAI